MSPLAFIAALLFSVSALAAEPSVVPDDPSCVGKFKGQICQLPDRSGGVCAPARCGAGDRVCLRCQAVPNEIVGKDGDLWVPMLSFGILVTVIGSVFWFRLKRNWESKRNDTNPRSGPPAP